MLVGKVVFRLTASLCLLVQWSVWLSLEAVGSSTPVWTYLIRVAVLATVLSDVVSIRFWAQSKAGLLSLAELVLSDLCLLCYYALSAEGIKLAAWLVSAYLYVFLVAHLCKTAALIDLLLKTSDDFGGESR